MKKIINVFFMISIFLIGCTAQPSQNSEERSDIVEWGKQIAKFEKDAELVVNDYYKLTSKLISRYPTDEELNKLTAYYNITTFMYNELDEITPPAKASSVHEKYVENYSNITDSILYYTIAVRQNDITYFEKSVSSSKDANQIGESAYKEFVELLEHYSISCNEINFCE